MLRIVQNTSVGGAKSYYSTADYYTEGQELTGTWRGLGAERLGLSGAIQKSDWDALCDNLDPRPPHAGEQLMPRNRRVRRVGYDLNFHCPKSVSVLYGLTSDQLLLDAFRDSVNATMQDMEAEMQTRVRSQGRNEDRTTGNLVWGEFIHLTARPIDGVPDPHLHAHCFAFNTTFDPEEQRWKAGQFAGLKRDAPFFEAVFHSHLARRIEELGLRTERTRTGWEIAGVPTTAIEKFSRRTAAIEAEAKDKGITDPHAKGELGARTREHKVKDLPMDQLRQQWHSRLSADEQSALENIRERTGSKALPEDEAATRDAVLQAIDHCFERSAVLPERTLLTESLKRSVGKAAPDRAIARTRGQPLITRTRDSRRFVTSAEVLREEQGMLAFAKSGRGACRSLAPAGYQLTRDWLTDEQQAAVRHVLTRHDRVILVRGAAGTGKTTMMQEAADGIRAGGHDVLTFAPSAAASRGVLRHAGFGEAETVARLLVDPQLQDRARGQVIWIDEAGLLGSRTTAQVFSLADRLDARVVLSGDRRQHGSVERGGALRLLEDEAGLIPTELRQVRRQTGEYKRAVEALGEGRTAEGFTRLSDLGWIKEIGDQERYRVLAAAYLDSTSKAGSTLVVCPTHAESDRITAEIRDGLKATGRLSTDERAFTKLIPLQLTEAQRADRLSYQPGDVLVYHQNARGHRKGDRLIVGADPVPTEQANRFSVFRPGFIRLAPGDRVRITKNATSMDKAKRLNNGDLAGVEGFTARGEIILDSGAVLAPGFGHLDYGYVVTSHASQGRSVDRVIIGQSAESLPASSREQFYVSVSRGKKQATIFTDDKRALLDAVSHGDERLTATELIHERERRERGSTLQRRELLAVTPPPAREPTTVHEHREIDHDR
ncbi:MAG: relaxase domain-containing protein [Phycisphaeraceae bacterium]|nr:relaxase domain-containing protein [Phycisphaeraceae bacterium]